MWLLASISVFAEGPPTRCVRISLIEDGKPATAPARITFIDGSEREEVEVQEQRYCVPGSMLGADTLDLTFDTAGSRFNLFHVRMDVFEADWELAFGSKHYAKEEHLGKMANVEESCTLHIHRAEGEKALTLAGCRLALTRQK